MYCLKSQQAQSTHVFFCFEGSEWVQEDVIYLKNIRLPRLPAIDPNIDLAYLHEEGDHWLKKRQVGIETLTKNLSHSDLESQDNDGGCYERIQPKIQGISYILVFNSIYLYILNIYKIGLLSVPSYATILTLKKSIEHRGNVCPLTQKNLVQLDWVSKEDGSHILTVGVSFFNKANVCIIFKQSLTLLYQSIRRLDIEYYCTHPFRAQLLRSDSIIRKSSRTQN